MDYTTKIYSDDTLISQHTSKPISSDNCRSKSLIFYCKPCNLKLTNPIGARQHLTGKIHELRCSSDKNVPIKKTNVPVRKTRIIQEPYPKEPVNKRSKIEGKKPMLTKMENTVAKDKIKCDDCNLEFNSELNAIQHFKGKKHGNVVAAKVFSKQKSQLVAHNSNSRNNQVSNKERGKISLFQVQTPRPYYNDFRRNADYTTLAMPDISNQRPANQVNNYFKTDANFSNDYTDEYVNNYRNDNYSSNYANDYTNDNSDNYPNDYSTDYTNNNFDLASDYSCTQQNHYNSYPGEMKSNLCHEINRLKRRLDRV